MIMCLPKVKIDIEKWKFSRKYQIYVSNKGNFKDKQGNILKPMVGSRTGYCHVETAIGIKPCHRIVLSTWKPDEKEEELTVDHRNHNKRDNSLLNLEWVSGEENLTRAAADLYIENGQLANENKNASNNNSVIALQLKFFTLLQLPTFSTILLFTTY